MGVRRAAVVRLLRPEQWLKNGFVLAPVVFAGRALDPTAWARAVPAALAFCAAASAGYAVNDLLDRNSDRNHPQKRMRPLAAGEIGAGTAGAVAAALAVVGLLLGGVLGRGFLSLLLAYVLLTALYSLGLKHAVFLDVLLVAAGFVLRVAAGAVAVRVPVSSWLVVCAYLLALYLALGKRRAELVLLGDDAENHRAVLGRYTLPLVDQAIAVVLGATVVAYALYTVAPETVAKVGSEGLVATVPVVMYGLFRYLYLLHRHELGGSPSTALFTDRPLLLTVIVWLAVAAAVITFG